MIKLKIPKEKEKDEQKYVIIETLIGPGPITRDVSHVVSEGSLNVEKQILQNQIVKLQANIQSIDDKIAEIKK